MPRPPRELDAAALALFARKGTEGRSGGTQVGDGNAVKVRRVMQITRDLTRMPMAESHILDLGCGDGVYAIEAGLQGAEVLAIDARTERMTAGIACASRHGLTNVTFQQEDVRNVGLATHGEFDVVYCLGLLYHLDVPDVFRVLENLQQMCTGLLVIDTWVSGTPEIEVTHLGRPYAGVRVREHSDEDPAEMRRRRLLNSIDNALSFHFTRAALFRVVYDVGFSSVFECVGPPEPGKPSNRLTLAACNGQRATVASYPWVNDLSEDEIDTRLS
jgi:SAM-dependent methyltransferase